MTAPHFTRAYEYVDEVARELSRERGTKKAEREDMVRKLNGALASLRSSALHEETPNHFSIPQESGYRL